MSNKEAAERACKEPNPIIDGRKANVNLAILGAKPRGNLTGNHTNTNTNRYSDKNTNANKNTNSTQIPKKIRYIYKKQS